MDMVVETSGRITNLRIANSVGAGCDEEAIRLVKMLRFKPGTKDGTYVRSNIQFMISFALPDEAGYRYFPTQQGGSMQ
jgi:protein TonB